MPQPSASDLQVVDPLLTNMSVAYIQSDTNFMADKVFPPVDTDVQGGKYSIYTKDAWFRAEARVRAPATETAGAGWALSSASFFIEVIGVHKDVDDITAAVARSRAGGVFDLNSDATRFVSQQLMLKRDLQFAASFLVTGVWGTDRAGVASGPTGNQFIQFDAANSHPVVELKKSILAMAKATGYKPNCLVIGPEVWNVLSEHVDLINRIQYVERAIVTEDLLASLLGLDKVVVAWSVQNTANEGATAAMNFVAGKSMLLAYAASSPSLLTPSAGYTFRWTGYPGAGAGGVRIKNFRIEEIGANRIEGEYAVAPAIVASDLGVFFSAAVS